MEEVNHLRDYLTDRTERGCPICGNVRTHILIDKETKERLDYKVCCPNCGVTTEHVLLKGFNDNEEAFNFLLTGDKNGVKKGKIQD